MIPTSSTATTPASARPLEDPVTAPSTPWRRRGVAAGLLSLTLAGTLGAGAASAQPGFAFDTRLDGATRVETAVKASQWLYPAGTTSPDVVLVNADATVDGLAASYLAGLKNATILYTGRDEVPAATLDEVERLGVERVWVVGGPAVVSAALEDELDDDYEVERYSGADRYETAAAVATAGEFQPERVFVTSGLTLADAVVAGPVAWARAYPILLTRPGSVPAATAGALDDLVTTDVTVVGGTTVVTDATYAALGATQRIGGANRQETAVLFADDAVDNEGFTHGNAALVGGLNNAAADALSGAGLAGSTGTPLLYVVGNSSVGTATAAYLRANASELDAQRSEGFVLGGQQAVSDVAVAQATAAAQ